MGMGMGTADLRLAVNFIPVVVRNSPFSTYYRYSPLYPSSVGRLGRNFAVALNIPDGYMLIKL
jgi:hypothetical protein